MRKHNLKLPKRLASIVINDISAQISTQQQVHELIISQASYQIIPGYAETYNQQIDQIIRLFLPYSESRLLDITLPYLFYDQHAQQTRPLARYLLYNYKLIAIKICISEEWPNQKQIRISPSTLLQKYYRQHNIAFTHNQIIVGNFYLQLNNCRIGLFFQSQLIKYPSFLTLVDQYKFDIVSVTANMQRKISKQHKTFLINNQQKQLIRKLKLLSRQKNLILCYSGIKIVPNMNTIYWEKSFIMQGLSFIPQSRALIGQKNFVSFIADLNEATKKKWIKSNASERPISIDVDDQIYLDKVSIFGNLKENDSISVNEVTNTPNYRYMSEFVGLRQVTVLNLWYLYKTVNKSSPFVLPYPFSEKRNELFNCLIALHQYSNLDIKNLIQIYRYKSQAGSLRNNIKIYDSFDQLLEQNKTVFHHLIYIYCQDIEQMNKLRCKEYGHRICNCSFLIPIASFDKIQPENLNTEALQSKKLQNACVYVLNQRYQSIQKILAYFWDISLNKKQIQKCFSQIIPNKIKKFFKLAPHYLFLIHFTRQQILEEIGQAEIRLKSSGKSRIVVQQYDGNKNIQEIPKRFSEKIEAAKAFKNKLQHQLKCHLCDNRFKKDLTYTCSTCKTVLCFDCIDILSNRSLFEFNNYKCVICRGICKCQKCQKAVLPPPPIVSQKQVSNSNGFNAKDFQCGRCDILGIKYDMIRIQCTQCKFMRCYSCAKLDRRFSIAKMNEWICSACEKFNQTIVRVNSQSELVSQNDHTISIHMEQELVFEDSLSKSHQQNIQPEMQIAHAREKVLLENDLKNKAIQAKEKQKNKDSEKVEVKRDEIKVNFFRIVNQAQQSQNKSKKWGNNAKHQRNKFSSNSSSSKQREKHKKRNKSRSRSNSSRSRSKDRKSKQKIKKRSSSSSSNNKKHNKNKNNNRQKGLWGHQNNNKKSDVFQKKESSAQKEKYLSPIKPKIQKSQPIKPPHQIMQSQKKGLIFQIKSKSNTNFNSDQSY